MENYQLKNQKFRKACSKNVTDKSEVAANILTAFKSLASTIAAASPVSR